MSQQRKIKYLKISGEEQQQVSSDVLSTRVASISGTPVQFNGIEQVIPGVRVVDGTKITFGIPGSYCVHVVVNVTKGSEDPSKALFKFVQNGVVVDKIPALEVHLPEGANSHACANYRTAITTEKPEDHVELYWESADLSVSLAPYNEAPVASLGIFLIKRQHA